MADNNIQIAAIRKDTKETLKIVLLMNNSLQSFKQETLLRFEKHETRFDAIDKQLKELKELILKGDQALVKLLVERERDIEKLTERVNAVEARMYALEHRANV